MGGDIERRHEESLTPDQSLLKEIEREALVVVQTEPGICDRLGYPGHHPGIYDLERSSGSNLYRLDGETIYDASNFWMTLPINIEKWFGEDDNLLKAIGRAALRSPTVSEFASSYQALFLQKISEYWPKTDRVLTYPGGTLATDAVVKWIIALVKEKNNYPPDQMRVIAAESAFHGRAGYPAELTRASYKSEDWQTGWAVRIPDPIVVFDETGEILVKETQEQVKTSLEQVADAFEKNPGVAGLMTEYPIMAEGGALLIDETFMDGARSLCDIHGKVMGVDCVQMFGRGWFFPQKAMEVADAIAIGKISRVPAAVLTDQTSRGFIDHAKIPGKYGATWAGLESQVLSALSIFRIIEENNLFENGLQMTDYLYQELRWLAKSGKGIIRPRIAGTYVGFDLETSQARQKLIETMRDKHNILLLSAGDSAAVRLSPRLDVALPELDHLLTSLISSL